MKRDSTVLNTFAAAMLMMKSGVGRGEGKVVYGPINLPTDQTLIKTKKG